MGLDQWRKVEQLYDSARARPEGERVRFLAEACQGDPELQARVEALLANPMASRHASPLEDTRTMGIGAGANSSSSRWLPGSLVGHYRIESTLGAGGMGQVYRALDTRLGRSVAIKSSVLGFDERFRREAQLIAALNHPNICHLYDAEADYLVMELVEGETVRRWLMGAPGLDLKLSVARQVLEALRAAHAAGIVHRDLKPDNIMVRTDGYVKVLDFGLAKLLPGAEGVLDNGAEPADLSVPGQILGTVAYMPPERVLGREAEPRSDLFSFGVILYEMLTGRHPWPRQSAVDTLHAILHDESSMISQPSLRSSVRI